MDRCAPIGYQLTANFLSASSETVETDSELSTLTEMSAVSEQLQLYRAPNYPPHLPPPHSASDQMTLSHRGDFSVRRVFLADASVLTPADRGRYIERERKEESKEE